MAGILIVTPAFAGSPAPDRARQLCEGSGGVWAASSGSCDYPGTQTGGVRVQSLILSTINAFLYLTAAVAVVMLIVGGFKYVTSGGDQNTVKSAKNTIQYAVIGLVVAILAYAIVRFVSRGLFVV